MSVTNAGYREVEHTADWELEVWAPDLAGLLVEAAHGMIALTGVQVDEPGRVQRRILLQTRDAEGLIVDFLGELLWAAEEERVGFTTFELEILQEEGGCRLDGTMTGGGIASQMKEIKAVTYHRLAVRETERGLEVRIVFDV